MMLPTSVGDMDKECKKVFQDASDAAAFLRPQRQSLRLQRKAEAAEATRKAAIAPQRKWLKWLLGRGGSGRGGRNAIEEVTEAYQETVALANEGISITNAAVSTTTRKFTKVTSQAGRSITATSSNAFQFRAANAGSSAVNAGSSAANSAVSTTCRRRRWIRVSDVALATSRARRTLGGASPRIPVNTPHTTKPAHIIHVGRNHIVCL